MDMEQRLRMMIFSKIMDMTPAQIEKLCEFLDAEEDEIEDVEESEHKESTSNLASNLLKSDVEGKQSTREELVS